MESSKRKNLIAVLAIMLLSTPFAIAAEGEMTGEELSALLGAGKKINLGGDGEGHSGILDIKSDGTASGSVLVQVPGKTIPIPIEGTWKISENRFCRKWREFDAGAEVCEVWKKIGAGRVEAQVNGKKVGVNWWTVPVAAVATNSDMTGDELNALLGAGKKINLGGGRENYSGVLDIRSDGTASGSVQVPGKTIPLDGTWKITENRFCRKWREVDAGSEVCEVWKKIGDGRVEAQVNGKKASVNWW